MSGSLAEDVVVGATESSDSDSCDHSCLTTLGKGLMLGNPARPSHGGVGLAYIHGHIEGSGPEDATALVRVVGPLVPGRVVVDPEHCHDKLSDTNTVADVFDN